jgi:hypothetical protein
VVVFEVVVFVILKMLISSIAKRLWTLGSNCPLLNSNRSF